MIDCENEVYTRIATALRAAHPGIDVSGVLENVPAAFPHVTVEMTDNREIRSADGHEREEVTFTVNIFSTAPTGKKTEAKKIAQTVDEAFRKINGRRLMLSRTPNEDDPTIYRITGQFQFATDGVNFYRS